MIRPSSLQIAEVCDLAPVLAEEFPGTSRDIDYGHAVDQQACRELLTGARAENPDAHACAWWIGEHLRNIQVQVPVELHDPVTGELLSRGTPDVVGDDVRDDVLTVVDMKKRDQWFAGYLAPADSNLQLHAYALAEMQARGRDRYRLCLLLFGEGAVEPAWSSSTFEVQDSLPILDRIRAICRRPREHGIRPKGVSGPHCMGCFQRRHCPHWMLPATAAGSELAPLAKPGGLTRENAERVLLAWMQARELCEQVKAALEEFATRDGAIRVGEDKEWGPQVVRGRRSVSVKDLEEAGLDQFIRKGEPSVRFVLRRK
jgi:hypothetical protein